MTYVATKQELFKRSDIVSIHMVLSERTQRMVTGADLALMKPTAFFINTSRGPLIDEPALIQVLQEKKIAGAGLDVFDQEPLPLDHPLRKLTNITLSPHTGYVSDSNYEVGSHEQSRVTRCWLNSDRGPQAFWGQTVENIAAFLDGRPTRVIG